MNLQFLKYLFYVDSWTVSSSAHSDNLKLVKTANYQVKKPGFSKKKQIDKATSLQFLKWFFNPDCTSCACCVYFDCAFVACIFTDPVISAILLRTRFGLQIFQ